MEVTDFYIWVGDSGIVCVFGFIARSSGELVEPISCMWCCVKRFHIWFMFLCCGFLTIFGQFSVALYLLSLLFSLASVRWNM